MFRYILKNKTRLAQYSKEDCVLFIKLYDKETVSILTKSTQTKLFVLFFVFKSYSSLFNQNISVNFLSKCIIIYTKKYIFVYKFFNILIKVILTVVDKFHSVLRQMSQNIFLIIAITIFLLNEKKNAIKLELHDLA